MRTPMHRRLFLKSLGAALIVSPNLFAMGASSKFNVGLLKYDGHYNPRPTAIRRLLLETEKVTNIEVNTNDLVVSLGEESLWDTPLLIWAGDQKFDPLPQAHIDALRRYVQAGGMIIVDSSEGLQEGLFLQSVKRDLARVFPDRNLARVPRDHVVYKSFYLIERPLGRLAISDALTGYWDDERVSVIISANDMLGAWARDNFGNWLYECAPGGERQRDLSFRLGVNLVMYAVCINYKADQVHIPFILGRRKWKVD